MNNTISIGMGRIHMEVAEVRDFLPNLISHIEQWGGKIVLEHGYGSGMGLTEQDYLRVAPKICFASPEEVYQQDVVLVLRYPDEKLIRTMRPGACLISMLHFPTRPTRVEFLRSLGIEAISLDSLKDDTGRRMVENLRLVAWNGVDAAYRVLRSVYPHPGLESPHRPPIEVTLLGAGSIGMHVVQAAIRYGDNNYWRRMVSMGVPGVRVSVVDYDLTNHYAIMQDLLRRTDILVDATQREDPSIPVIPNDWIAFMAPHAVLLDLSVDPYDCENLPYTVKGIEGIPQGNLDKYTFNPDDPAYDLIPACVNSRYRRYAVSCYSWPGITPKKCMDIYGKQIAPVLRTLIVSGGTQNIDQNATYFHRAIQRAMLSRWQPLADAQ
jgi:alanine dehydrogenase